MIQKYFPRDKNYLLKDAQDAARDSLLEYLVAQVRKAYFRKFNPLGLDDPLSQKIRDTRKVKLDCLNDFYHSLAAIYRFKFGENQLQFLFDGRTHLEKYRDDWDEAFRSWIQSFCQYENFIKATLELTLIIPNEKDSLAMATRMKAFLSGYFDIRIRKQRGIIEKDAA